MSPLKLLKSVLFLGCIGSHLLSSQAMADGGAAQAAVGVVGLVSGAAGVTSVAFQGLISHELRDWKSVETGSTSQLSRSCNINFEARLIGDSRKNYLYFGIKNDTANSLVLKSGEIRMTYSSGRERSASYPFEINDYELKPSWKVLGLAPFPEKSDILGQSWITVKVPLYDGSGKVACTLENTFFRDESHPQDQGSYIEHSVLDYSFEFGSSLARSGALKSLGDNGFNFGLFLYGYGSVHHGLVFGLTIENYSGPYSDLNYNTFLLGYSYRALLSPRWSLSFDLAPAIGYFRYGSSGDLSSDTSSLSVFSKLSLYFNLGTFGRGALMSMDNLVGVSVYNLASPWASLAGTSVSGDSLGASLFYRMGL